MSVTLWIPRGPRCVTRNPHFDPDEPVSVFNEKFREDYIWPDLNVANGNAGIICALLGVDDYPIEIAHEQIPFAIRSVMKAKNSKAAASLLVRPDVSHGENYVHCGCPSEQIESYCTRILEILAIARDNNVSVTFA